MSPKAPLNIAKLCLNIDKQWKIDQLKSNYRYKKYILSILVLNYYPNGWISIIKLFTIASTYIIRRQINEGDKNTHSQSLVTWSETYSWVKCVNNSILSVLCMPYTTLTSARVVAQTARSCIFKQYNRTYIECQRLGEPQTACLRAKCVLWITCLTGLVSTDVLNVFFR